MSDVEKESKKHRNGGDADDEPPLEGYERYVCRINPKIVLPVFATVLVSLTLSIMTRLLVRVQNGHDRSGSVWDRLQGEKARYW